MPEGMTSVFAEDPKSLERRHKRRISWRLPDVLVSCSGDQHLDRYKRRRERNMIKAILSAIKSALRFALELCLMPIELLFSSLGGRPLPRPPSVPLPEPPEVDADDPWRRIAQEVRRWAKRMDKGTEYEPAVPDAIRTWLRTLDAPSISRISRLTVPALRQSLMSGCTVELHQSSSSSRASAAASARSALNARARQNSAASRHVHSSWRTSFSSARA
jgi:hypothetical protein